MKSTFLKAVKIGALSLALSLGASGVIFANGAGASPTKAAAFNGAGGSSTTWNKRKARAKRRVARRVVRRAKVKTATHGTH